MAEAPADRIFIRDLRTRCIVGVYPEEREKRQDVVINLVLYADVSKAGQSDDIADTVDYKHVKNAVLDLVEQSEYRLIERLAERVAEVVLDHPGVEAVDVTVDKPGALRFADSVAIQITRRRGGGDGG